MRTNSTFAAACQVKKEEDPNCFSIFSLQREGLVLGLHGSRPLRLLDHTRPDGGRKEASAQGSQACIVHCEIVATVALVRDPVFHRVSLTHCKEDMNLLSNLFGIGIPGHSHDCLT